MKPHPRIRKTIKWGGAVVTVLLVVVWIGSGWWEVWTPVAFVRAGELGLIKRAYTLPPVGTTLPRTIPPTPLPTASVAWRLKLTPFALNWTPRPLLQSVTTGYSRVLIQAELVTLWPFALVGVVCVLTSLVLDLLLSRRHGFGRCPKCNYDRTGLAAGAVCPECGAASSSAT